MKKFLAVLTLIALCTLACFTFAGCEGEADYVVDILKFGNFAALNNASDGFKDTLNAWAKENGKTVKFNEHDANAESSYVSTIVKDAMSNVPDYIYAIATPCAVSGAGATTTIPVFYTAVTDPADSGLTTRSNVFGTSDMQPIAKQMQLVKLLCPSAKSVAFLFSSNETNSRTQVNIAKTACDSLGLTYKEYQITDAANIRTTVQAIEEDVIYIPTDNTLSNAMATVSTANTANKPIIVGEEGMLENGGWATLGVNYYSLGEQTAKMVIEHITTGTVANAHQSFSGTPELAVSESAKTALGLDEQKLEQIKTQLGE